MRWLLGILTLLLVAWPIEKAEARAFAAAESWSSAGIQTAYEWCDANTRAAAESCALRKCRASGGRNCSIAEYCVPARWSGAQSMHRSNKTSQDVSVCERPSRRSVINALKGECQKYRNASPRLFARCQVTAVVDPKGNFEANAAEFRWRNGRLLEVQ
jgi:hypothetical protein